MLVWLNRRATLSAHKKKDLPQPVSLGRAASIRWFNKLLSLINDAIEYKDFSALRASCEITDDWNSCVEHLSQWKGKRIQFPIEHGSYSEDLLDDRYGIFFWGVPSVPLLDSECKKNGQDIAILHASQAILAIAALRFTERIHFSLELRSEGLEWDVTPKLVPKTPWDAIGFCLANKLTSRTSIRFCAKPGCGKQITGTAGKKYCGEAHKKWCVRNGIRFKKKRNQ